jgi:hypothetical protein
MVFFIREWRKNADEFLSDLTSTQNSRDESIRAEWELTYIAERNIAKRKMEPPN